MKIKRRFPNFVDVGDYKEEYEISTLEEFNEMLFIKDIWLKNPDFDHFSYSADFGTHGGYPEILMAELKNKEYWGIAYVMSEGSLAEFGFPEWKHPSGVQA